MFEKLIRCGVAALVLGCGVLSVEAAPSRNAAGYRAAAEKGDARAQNELGMCYFKGEGVEKDPKLAEYWIRKAAEQGYAPAQCNLGRCCLAFHKGEDAIRQALHWFRKSAEQGYPEAQAALGAGYAYGIGGLPKDPELAASWIRKSAEQGYPFGQVLLGRCCWAGAMKPARG